MVEHTYQVRGQMSPEQTLAIAAATAQGIWAHWRWQARQARGWLRREGDLEAEEAEKRKEGRMLSAHGIRPATDHVHHPDRSLKKSTERTIETDETTHGVTAFLVLEWV